MRYLGILVTAILISFSSVAQQEEKPHIYNPEANAEQQIKTAVAEAAKENKHVLVQIGGNWCIWCVRFHNLENSNDTLKQLVNDNYVVVYLNYSKENKNEKMLAKLGYPQRFGFPVFVVLDKKGNRIHTQKTQGTWKKVKDIARKKWQNFLNSGHHLHLTRRTIQTNSLLNEVHQFQREEIIILNRPAQTLRDISSITNCIERILVFTNQEQPVAYLPCT